MFIAMFWQAWGSIFPGADPTEVGLASLFDTGVSFAPEESYIGASW